MVIASFTRGFAVPEAGTPLAIRSYAGLLQDQDEKRSLSNSLRTWKHCVQTAASMTSDRGTITLHGLSPSTLYFADRPKREVGHMSSAHFVANWPAGDNSFADNPPNAVLSFSEPGDRLPEDTVVVIQDPHLDGDALTYGNQAPRRHGADRHWAMCAVH